MVVAIELLGTLNRLVLSIEDARCSIRALGMYLVAAIFRLLYVIVVATVNSPFELPVGFCSKEKPTVNHRTIDSGYPLLKFASLADVRVYAVPEPKWKMVE